MPISKFGGFMQGVSEGLRNVAVIRGMQQGQLAEERAGRREQQETELYGRNKKEWEDENTPFIPVEAIKEHFTFDSNPELANEVESKLSTIGISLKPGTKLTRKQVKEGAALVQGDDVLNARIKWNAITEHQKDLDQLVASLDQSTSMQKPQIQGAIKNKQEIIDTLKATSKPYMEAQGLKIKQEEQAANIEHRKAEIDRLKAKDIRDSSYQQSALEAAKAEHSSAAAARAEDKKYRAEEQSRNDELRKLQLENDKMKIQSDIGLNATKKQTETLKMYSPLVSIKVIDTDTGEERTEKVYDYQAGLPAARKDNPDMFPVEVYGKKWRNTYIDPATKDEYGVPVGGGKPILMKRGPIPELPGQHKTITPRQETVKSTQQEGDFERTRRLKAEDRVKKEESNAKEKELNKTTIAKQQAEEIIANYEKRKKLRFYIDEDLQRQYEVARTLLGK